MNESFEEFRTFFTWTKKELGYEVLTIHSNHGVELKMLNLNLLVKS